MFGSEPGTYFFYKYTTSFSGCCKVYVTRLFVVSPPRVGRTTHVGRQTAYASRRQQRQKVSPFLSTDACMCICASRWTGPCVTRSLFFLEFSPPLRGSERINQQGDTRSVNFAGSGYVSASHKRRFFLGSRRSHSTFR